MFVDFSKAFDRVNYWKLFIKLLNDDVVYSIVRELAEWYSNQECRVRWRSSYVSACFYMSSGTRQGGVLSPLFILKVCERQNYVQLRI